MNLEIIIILILLMFLNSLEIFGFYAATYYETDSKGNIENKNLLWFIRYFSEQTLGEYWTNPITNCPVCMPSLHSLWIWIPIYYFMPFAWNLIYVHIFYMLVLCGLNKLILTKVDL